MSKIIKLIQSPQESQVSNSIVNKIYNMLYQKQELNNDVIDLTNSNIAGTITLNGPTYEEYITYIRETFPNLYINCESYYILFKDETVKNILLAAGCGDGVGVTLLNARTFNIGQLFRNKNIKYFPEFSKFTYNNNTLTTNNMFEGCSSLESIDMSEYTKNVSDGMFRYCSSLQTCNVPLTTSVGSGAYQQSGITSVDLPNATRISHSSFSKCANLTTVNIPNVTEFGNAVFNDCTLLETINIDWTKVTSFGSAFLGGCTSFGYNLTVDISTDQSDITNAFGYTAIKKLIIHAHNLSSNHDVRYPPYECMPNLEYLDMSDTNYPNWGDAYGSPSLVTLVANNGIRGIDWRFLLNVPECFKYAILLQEDPSEIDSNDISAGMFRDAPNAHLYVKDETVKQRYLNNVKFSQITNFTSKIKTLSELPVGVWTTGLYKQYEPYLSHSSEYD